MITLPLLPQPQPERSLHLTKERRDALDAELLTAAAYLYTLDHEQNGGFNQQKI